MVPRRWLAVGALLLIGMGRAMAQEAPTIPVIPPGASVPAETTTTTPLTSTTAAGVGPTIPVTTSVPGPVTTLDGSSVSTSTTAPAPTTTRPPGPTTTTTTTVVPPRAVLPGDGCHAFRPADSAVPTRALFPGCRLIAYYGNFQAPSLGVLGQGTRFAMITRLRGEVLAWQAADPATAAICGFELIVTVAQARPGTDGLYRSRMSDRFIGEALSLARQANCLLIMDVQVGRSTVAAELPRLVRWLQEPDVHLALDPEWAMGPGQVPGKVIGSLDATDVNTASVLLSQLVKDGDLPPKMLAVHRFTLGMLTRPELLRTDPGVQLVVNMDGFGPPARKLSSYGVAKTGVADPRMGLKLF